MQAERALQAEVMVRLRYAPVDALIAPVPNGIWLPAHTEAEKVLVRRLIARLKQDGHLTPGVADLLVLWAGGSGCIELKRPAAQTLNGKVAAGKQNTAQREFEQRARAVGVNYVICDSWPAVRETLRRWGRIPQSYQDPEDRIGRRTVASSKGEAHGHA